MGIFSSSYQQGVFVPTYPHKCMNLNGKCNNGHPVTYRSSWELRFCNFLDRTKSVIAWGNELIEIEYFSQLDGKAHRYITDFCFIAETRHSGRVKYLVEVKPKIQVPMLNESGQVVYPQAPKTKSKKKMVNWTELCNTLQKNNEKWTAAREWCKRHDYIFKIITEEELQMGKYSI